MARFSTSLKFRYTRKAKAGPVIHYVKAGGIGNGDSWANAAGDLQAMINSSSAGDEVWVAAGTYRPNRRANTLNTITPNDRDNAFVLRRDVRLYGGFPPDAINGIGMESRDWKTHETILSGELGHDPTDHAYQVVIAVDVTGSAELNGFTITGGNADSKGIRMFPTSHGLLFLSKLIGGGMVNVSSSLSVMNCTFVGNQAMGNGGGMHNSSAAVTLTNCVFMDNYAARDGGGMCNCSASPIVNNCIFGKNHAAGNGGGMFNCSASPIMNGCTIAGNRAIAGSEIANIVHSFPKIRDTFIGNAGVASGIYSDTISRAEISCNLMKGLKSASPRSPWSCREIGDSKSLYFAPVHWYKLSYRKV